jgi:phage gp36-like protein
MTYATQADLETRFKQQELIELTDEAGIGEIDAAAVAVALADTDAEINGYLAGRYSLPLTQTSPELVRLACDIARYRLYDIKATEQVKARYDDAVRKLIAVSTGKASLGIDQASEPVVATGSVKFSAPARVFNDDSLSGY